MTKSYYTQDQSKILEGNTEIIAIASDFLWPAIKSSLSS